VVESLVGASKGQVTATCGKWQCQGSSASQPGASQSGAGSRVVGSPIGSVGKSGVTGSGLLQNKSPQLGASGADVGGGEWWESGDFCPPRLHVQ
jgi:hypothetical protein